MDEIKPSYMERAGPEADRLLCRTILADRLQKENVYFTKRGNKSIEVALTLAKKQGRTTLLIPDQGGWMTYEQYAKKVGMKLFYVQTTRGKFDQNDISKTILTENLVAERCALLFSSMPAYAFMIDTEAITLYCTKNNILSINDVAASIAERDAHYGDIVIGSFGKAKPLPLHEGGFIAGEIKLFTHTKDTGIGDVDIGSVELGAVDIGAVTTKDDKKETRSQLDLGIVDIGDVNIGGANVGDADIGDADIGKTNIGPLLLEEEPELNYTLLAHLLETIKERTNTIKKKAEAFKLFVQEKTSSEILYPKDQGYNVIVAYQNDEEKERLINIATSFDTELEYTICPRYIRVEEQAISFEVKRFFTKEE